METTMITTINELQIFLHHVQSAEQKSGITENGHPGTPADHIEKGEMPIAHVSHAGHERSERPYDRNEPRQNNCFSAVFFIKACVFSR